MKLESNKKLILIVCIAAAAVGVVLAVHLFDRFAYSYRFKIGYFFAFILLAGTFVLLLRKPREGAAPVKGPVAAPFNKDIKKLLPIAVVIVCLAWAPYLFRGQDTHVKIFDNLDSHIPHTKVLSESGKAFSLAPGTRLDNFLNGIALSGVDSGYSVLTWLFMIFPPFTAYALNDLLIRLVALLGMVLLLKKHIITIEKKEHPWIIAGAGLCFALLPFYHGGGISIAGIPLLLYAFLNILNREEAFVDFLIIFIFPFYSKLALAGVFIAVALTVLLVVDCIKKKKINIPYLGGLALLTVTYIFTHFHLVYSFIDPDFSSFREEIDTVAWSTAESLKRTVHNFIFDRVNVAGAQHIFVMGAAALAVVVGVVKKLKTRLMSALVIACLLTSMMWGFKYWKGMNLLREKLQLLNAFDFSRFYWFNPFLWYIIFALALLIIAKIKYGKVIAAVFIVCQVLFMFSNYNWEYRYLLGIRSSFAGSPLTYSLTYKEFYSEALFNEIGGYINKPKKDYRVISLGIHPGVSQYNGFYTLDIYTDVYSLDYKHRFRKIIEKELEKSRTLQKGFDGNAKRCFLLVSELHGSSKTRGLAFSRGITKKEKHLKIKHLELNTGALKEMGGEYIFSAVEIVNYKENNLVFEKVFERKDSPWRIYLYRVVPPLT